MHKKVFVFALITVSGAILYFLFRGPSAGTVHSAENALVNVICHTNLMEGSQEAFSGVAAQKERNAPLPEMIAEAQRGLASMVGSVEKNYPAIRNQILGAGVSEQQLQGLALQRKEKISEFVVAVVTRSHVECPTHIKSDTGLAAGIGLFFAMVAKTP